MAESRWGEDDSTERVARSRKRNVWAKTSQSTDGQQTQTSKLVGTDIDGPCLWQRPADKTPRWKWIGYSGIWTTRGTTWNHMSDVLVRPKRSSSDCGNSNGQGYAFQ